MRRLTTAAVVLAALAASGVQRAEGKLPRPRPLLRVDRIDASDPPTVNLYLTELDGERQLKPLRKADAYRLSVNAMPLKTRGKLETFADRGEPLALVLVLQVSPAMKPVFKEMIRSAEGLVAALPPGSQVGLVAYAEALVEHLKPTSPAKIRAALGKLAIHEEALEVNLPFAVQEAIDSLKRATLPKRRVIAVVSDGLTAELKLRKFSQLARTARNRQIRVHTIGYSALEPDALQTLFELSGGRRADGTFRPVTSTQEVSRALDSLRRELLKQRVLSYELPQYFKGEIADFQVEADGLASEPVEVELVAWKGGRKRAAWYSSPWFITVVIALVLIALTVLGMLLWRRRQARAALASGDTAAAGFSDQAADPVYEDEDEDDGGAVAALVGAAPAPSAPATAISAGTPSPAASPTPSATASPAPEASAGGGQVERPETGPVPEWALGGSTPEEAVPPATKPTDPGIGAPADKPDTGPAVPAWALAAEKTPAAAATPPAPDPSPRPMSGMLKGVGQHAASPFAAVAPGAAGPLGRGHATPAPAPAPAGGGMPLLPSPTAFLMRARDDNDSPAAVPRDFPEPAAAPEPTPTPAPTPTAVAAEPRDPLLPAPPAADAPADPEPFGFGERKTQVMAIDEIESVDSVGWVVPLNTGTFETLVLRDGYSIGVDRGNYRVAAKEGQPTGGIFHRDKRGAWILDLAGVRLSAGQLRDNDRFSIGAVDFVLKEASRFHQQRRSGAAWLQVVGGIDDGRRIALAEGAPVTLGTHEGCQAVIRGEGLGARHLLARLAGGVCQLDDLGCEGGLRYRASNVGQVKLQPNEEVGFGQLRLVFRLQAKGRGGTQ